MATLVSPPPARDKRRMRANALTPLVDLVFPPRCPLCGAPLAEQGGLCVACWSRLVIPGEPACATCQRPLDETSAAPGKAEARCPPCRERPPAHDGLSAATLYTDASRDLVLAFKHGRRIALAGLLARLMATRLAGLEGDWLVVPVPLHRWRLWRRGFNQSALLARHLAEAPGRRLVVDALVRHRATPPLGGLDRRQRHRVLAGSLAAHPRRAAMLKGAQVLLVDDVVTSGATTDAAVHVLREAGAGKVRVACFARVLDEAL